MQPETPQAGETVNPESSVNGEAGTLAKLPTTEPSSAQQWRQTGREFSEQIVLLLERARKVFREYKPAIVAIGLALAAMPIVAFIVALLTVMNVIPLLAPALKLIGFGFTAWFVYRYLLFAPNRQELFEELQGLGKQVFGRQDSQIDFPQPVPAQAQASPDTPEPTSFAEPDSELSKPDSKSTSEPDSETSGPDPGQTPPNPPSEDGLREDPTEKLEDLPSSQAELKEPEAESQAEKA